MQGIPHKFDDQATGKLFDYILEFPGYLFLNDEDDGFRLTWAMDLWDIDGTCKSEITASPLTNGIDSVANIISSQETWEEFHSDKYTGRRLIPVENTPVPGVRVVSEAFLHVDVLLGAIIESKSFSESNPNFCYNLISVHHAGRTVDLIITFLRRQKPGSLGVFVRVDLFTGRYEEQDWVKSLCTKDASSLQAWCNTLALNRRMKQIRAGPYSIEAKHCIDWGRLSKESYFDCDEEDDFTPSVWREYVENQKNITTKKPPKFLSLSSLYPDCDLVTNKAITGTCQETIKRLELIEFFNPSLKACIFLFAACLPVASLQCKKSPIQLVYG